MKSAILSVGTEILFGQITNTNSVYISQQLNLLGFDVLYHYTVGDNDGRLSEIISLAFKDCDLIVTSGGLGPTEDDMTKETVCKVMGDVLVEHEPSMKALIAGAKKLGHKLTENNFKQAMMPSRAVVFDNDAGSAPGFCLEKDGKMIVCMPGPPREMTRMFQRRVKPYLQQFQENVIYYRTLRFFGKGESSLETDLLDLIDEQSDPTIATYAKEGECTVRVASKRKTREEAEAAVNEMVTVIDKRLGDYIYSLDDEELVDVVGRKLIEGDISISCAESCTGGMFAETLTTVPGISQVFDRGIVTYTCDSKVKELGVKQETLDACTVYSAEVAAEMASGLYAKTGSRICVSVTGIAGPGGAMPGKPVGLIYIGCAVDGEVEVKKVQMRNVNRNWNRHYAVLNMLDMVNRAIDRLK
jgi:nicotinamide-nucleotide amidase